VLEDACYDEAVELGIVLSGRIAMKALTALAGCLFLFSTLNPFVSLILFPTPDGPAGSGLSVEGKFWSFKEVLNFSVEWAELEFRHSTAEYWFVDYWGLTQAKGITASLEQRGVTGYGMNVLILVFIPQILTLGFAALSLLVRRLLSLWFLGTTVLSLVTALGMWLSSQQFLGTSFETGFWLALASAALFSAIFIASLAWTWKNRLARLYRRLLHR
jgi:hypothetical protein